MHYPTKVLVSIILTVLFFCEKQLCEMKIVKFTFGFIPYNVLFLIKFTRTYFRAIKSIFQFFSKLFFCNFIPLIFQILVVLYFSFNIVWDTYLVLSIFSMIVSVPFYIRTYNTKNNYVKAQSIFLKFQLKSICIIMFLVAYDLFFTTIIGITLSVIDICIHFFGSKENENSRYF